MKLKFSDFKNNVNNDSFFTYTEQLKQLRKLVVEKLGAEKTSEMSDNEIVNEIKKMGYIPMHIGLNEEEIFLVNEEAFNKMIVISR